MISPLPKGVCRIVGLRGLGTIYSPFGKILFGKFTWSGLVHSGSMHSGKRPSVSTLFIRRGPLNNKAFQRSLRQVLLVKGSCDRKRLETFPCCKFNYVFRMSLYEPISAEMSDQTALLGSDRLETYCVQSDQLVFKLTSL